MARNVVVRIILAAQDRASTVMGRLNKQFGALSRAAKVAAVAVAALGVAIVAVAAKKAAKFDTVMRQVSTLLNTDASPAFANMEERILNMSRVLPQSAEELGVGLYDVLSAGVEQSSEAFKVLEISAKAAVAGGFGVTTQDAVRTITGLLNAFQFSTDQAERVADVLFGTIKEGVVTSKTKQKATRTMDKMHKAALPTRKI